MNGQEKSAVFSPQMSETEDTSIESPHVQSPIPPLNNNIIPLITPDNYHINNDINIINASEINIKNHLPVAVVLLSNIQSFGKSGKTDKTIELELVLKLNKVQLGIFTETWLDEKTCQHLDIENYTMFHSIRSKALKASGGVSVFVKDDIPASRLNIDVPEHLEVIYVSVRPTWLPRSISNIIIAGVYYPGTSSKYAPPQEDLIQHLKEKVLYFYSKYADPLILLMGDFNDLVTKDILKACKLKQVVKVPTRKKAILDLIMMNKSNSMYKEPITLPSIRDSDHLCVLLQPKDPVKSKIIKEKIMIRKFKKSSILAFGFWLTRFDWSELFILEDVNDKVAYFTTITWIMVEKYFPLTPITVTNTDKEWITPKIKRLILKRQNAHRRKNYKLRDALKREIKKLIRKTKFKFHAKKRSKLLVSSSKEWYRHVSNIIGNKKNNVNLTNIPELANKTTEEQVKIVNNHFANICRRYPSLNMKKIDEPSNEKKLSMISELQTFKFLRKLCKKSLGPGDLPKKLLQEFTPEFSTPFCDIINCAIRTGIFPDAFKKAEIITIPKVNPPRSLSDLRPISKTAVCGKIIEKVMMSELQKDVKGKLDLDQYGNTTGSSTTHYLIKLTDQAYKSTDKGGATTAITIDYSKAFDYVDHGVLIDKLMLLGVRARLINLIISFLSDRSHNTKIKGIVSEFLPISCGVPQGTVGGPKLFVILINGIKCKLVDNYKFIDDKTLSLSYRGIDPSSTLQKALDIEAVETIRDKMIINELKCNIINFNFSEKNIVPQNLKLNGNNIVLAKKIKLLGVIITDDLKWEENTSLICSKVEGKFYLISKLKSFGLQVEELLNIWKVMVRPITEYAAPLWHSGLSDSDIKRIENLQKTALGMILGTMYIEHKRYYKFRNMPVSYEFALQKYGLTTLLQRREVLTQKFALETVKNPNHRNMFEFIQAKNMTTRNSHTVQEKFCKTDRYYNSAIPFMSRILNGVFITEKKDKRTKKRPENTHVNKDL